MEPIPLGFSLFPKEIVVVPQLWVGTMGNLVHVSEHEHGGHFAAHEQPAELVEDLRRMFANDGPARGVVSGQDGYA